ncbi:hypothetical protein H0H92_012294 [Tricholoma furcatifolium]|nr:hypothetical protein H0H92_012294 [Tricholoma furcatifolium]
MARAWSLSRVVKKPTQDALLPGALFTSLAFFATRFIFGHLYASGLALNLGGACAPQSSASQPYRLAYTGLDRADAMLCPLVTFFHAAFEEPDAITALKYFISISGPLITIPTIESCRAKRSISIAFPVVLGLLSQTLTIGFTFPIYWLIFIVSGGANTGWGRPEDALITQAHAEAIIFGLFVGAAIPSIGMVVFKDPQVTAIWQPYPAYFSLAQLIHLSLRPASKHSASGYNTIRFLFIGMFMLSSSIHIATMWPLFTDLDTIFRVYLPSFVIPEHSTTVGTRVLHFLKWDLAFGFGSSLVATLWFARGLKEVLTLLTWNVIATPLFGPGAALAGAALWRESLLVNQRSVGKGLKVKQS